jgi:hypothetical protein
MKHLVRLALLLNGVGGKADKAEKGGIELLKYNDACRWLRNFQQSRHVDHDQFALS